MVEIPGLPDTAVERLAARTLERGVAIYSATPCFLERPTSCHLMLGFTLPEEGAIARGIEIVAEETRSLMGEASCRIREHRS